MTVIFNNENVRSLSSVMFSAHLLEQRLANFSVRGQVVKILGFAGQGVSELFNSAVVVQ